MDTLKKMNFDKFNLYLIVVVVFVLISCSNMKTINAFIEGNNLIVEKSEFVNQETKGEYESIIVTSNYNKDPIVLFKRGENIYEAYSLVCTHDNEKLNIKDNLLVCPTDGSKFSKYGKVITGPAVKDLRQYSVDKTATTIEIKVK